MEYGRCLLADRLREARMTQQELADKAGIDKRQISDYVVERRVMSLLTAVKVAKALKCDVTALYEFP